MNLLNSIVKKIRLHQTYLLEVVHFWRLTVKYNATNNTDEDIEKMQYTLSRETHTLEKGMSMRYPRKGFGQQKAEKLINRLIKYIHLYGGIDDAFLEYPLMAIAKYIEFVKKDGTDLSRIEALYADLKKLSPISDYHCTAGVMIEKKDHILSLCNKDFKSLLESRHSIRYFTSERVSENIINEALILAQRTPSACNRQGWLTHVFRDEKSVNLIKWQGGSRGFEDEIKCSILVTANLKAFLSHEIHQAYIDGGLYAMNLINALHSLGLGTIPLSCGFNYSRLKQLSSFSIPENEVPIVIIGIGNLPESFKVAVSERKPIFKTNTNHDK